MAEVVAEVRLVREPGFLYYLQGNEVWRKPMQKVGEPARSPPELVWRGGFEREAGYFYFVDPRGNVARSPLVAGPSPPPPPQPAPRRRLPLPLSTRDYDDVASRVSPALACLLASSAAAKLERRTRWSSLVDPDVRALAAWLLDAEPTVLHLGSKVWIELTTREGGTFMLSAPIPRHEVLTSLRAVNASENPAMIELYETFGESDDFVVPSERHTFGRHFPCGSRWKNAESYLEAPIVFRAPNGDRVLLDRATGRFTWANREREEFEQAASSFGELLRDYLRAKIELREFDAFSAAAIRRDR